MFDKMMITILNRKMLENKLITQEEFDKIQNKINLLPNDSIGSKTEKCYTKDAV